MKTPTVIGSRFPSHSFSNTGLAMANKFLLLLQLLSYKTSFRISFMRLFHAMNLMLLAGSNKV